MTERGAPAALRGYRLQALYTLKRLFAPGVDPTQVFHPEGIEDLDIQDANGQVVEVLQVKSYANLKLSHLISKKKDDSADKVANGESFFHRAATLLRGVNPPIIKVLNFGEIGPQMATAWKKESSQRNTISKKLQARGFQTSDIEKFFSHIELVTLDEQSTLQSVFSQLQSFPTGIDHKHAFDLFVAWYYRLAEKRQTVTQTALSEKINTVGQTLAECYQHHQHWNITIQPLTTHTIFDKNRNVLRDEFYAGVHTRYEHILADLDFPREHKINEIKKAFQYNNVVIVHAASGQGKSTLAYRYLNDWYPENWRFTIQRVQDVTQALGMARALSGFAQAVQVPIAVYLDVHPRDIEWIELVKQLAQQPYLEILVTIREEDYRRTSIADAGFEYEEVELEFDRQEASLIYERARSAVKPSGFLDFEAAWDAFGGDGPLMEFVYLLTQTQTLPQRLKKQVHRIEEEVRMGASPDELRVLQLVSVASAHGARLCTRELLSSLKLPAANRTLTQFEKEYLLRRSTDGFYLEGLHPVRSEILSTQLIHPDIVPWLEVAVQAMPLMPEEDLETFILHAFIKRPEEYEQLVEHIMQLSLNSWSGIAGILRCLLWAGVKDYITTNVVVIDEAYSLMGPGWWFAVDLNFALEGEGLDLVEWWTTLGDLIPPENQERIRAIRQSQTPKPTIYKYASRWLENLGRPPTAPIPSNAWKDIAEVWYWSARLVPHQSIMSWIADETLAEVTETIPLPDLSDLSLALYLGCPERHRHWQEQHLATLKRRLAYEYDILALLEIETTLKIHFIPSGEASVNVKNQLHARTITRINLVRGLLPAYEKYASQGYGFHIAGVEFPQGDATRKDGIPVTKLLPLWATKLNGIASGLIRNRYRPVTWQVYLETIINVRKLIVECLQQLNYGVIKFCQRSKSLNVGSQYINLDDWQRCLDMLNNICELPILAVDPWGFAAESSNAAFLQAVTQQSFVPNAIALQKYRACLEVQRQYLSSMRNFFSQVPSVWIVNAYTGKLHPNDPHKTVILSRLEKQGVKSRPHLPIVNLFEAKVNLPDYQREFSALFNQTLDIGVIASLTMSEKDVIEETWDRWYFYAQEPWKSAANPQKQVRQWMKFAKRQLKSQIMQAVQCIQSFSCEPIFLEFEQDWQGHSALWIRLNLSNLVEFYNKLFIEFPTALKQTVGPIAPGSLTDYLRQEICTYLVVIPVIQGQLLNSLVWPFYLSTVLQIENLGDKPWSYLPSELPDSICEALQLTIWDIPEIALANQLSTSVATLRLLTSQVGEFQAISDPTEFGETRLRTYIEENVTPEVSKVYQTFLDTASVLFNRFNALPTAEQQKREKLLEAVQALLEVYKQINAGERDDGFELTLEEVTDYSNRLEQAYLLVEGIRLFWIADILEQKAV